MINILCPMKAYVPPGETGKVFGICDGANCSWFGDRGECAIKTLSELADNMTR
jgi:hypothetical protein